MIELTPGVTINVDTPENTLVGRIIVFTYSKSGYNKLTINTEDSYFYLDEDRIYLKTSGAKLPKRVTNIFIRATATDYKGGSLTVFGIIRLYTRGFLLHNFSSFFLLRNIFEYPLSI
jgi:hypothetical protein